MCEQDDFFKNFDDKDWKYEDSYRDPPELIRSRIIYEGYDASEIDMPYDDGEYANLNAYEALKDFRSIDHFSETDYIKWKERRTSLGYKQTMFLDAWLMEVKLRQKRAGIYLAKHRFI